MNIYDYQISFLEVPDEICLTFYVAGCNLNCSNCFWDKTKETSILDSAIYEALLIKYQNKVTTIVFLGGEWESNLCSYLNLAKIYKYKTCLYTGLTYQELETSKNGQIIINQLDFLKVGRYIESLGNLNSSITNQSLINLQNNKVILGNENFK